MELYLLRHAHAGDPGAWDGPDDRRPLSDKGERQAERLGRFLAGIGFRTDAIITSPKVRAAQTAEIVADLLGVPGRRGRPARRRADGLSRWRRSCATRATRGRPSSSGTTRTSATSSSTLCGASDAPMRKGSFARIDLPRARSSPAAGRCAGSSRRTCSSRIADRAVRAGECQPEAHRDHIRAWSPQGFDSSGRLGPAAREDFGVVRLTETRRAGRRGGSAGRPARAASRGGRQAGVVAPVESSAVLRDRRRSPTGTRPPGTRVRAIAPRRSEVPGAIR